jgi:hypothetical protein
MIEDLDFNNTINLIILGNGFDLAHGLKTGYKDFILKVVEDHLNDRSVNTDILEATSGMKTLDDIANSNYVYGGFKNHFFKKILQLTVLNNWCDIEYLYFKDLSSLKENPQKFNNNFQSIQNHLESYLTLISSKIEANKHYQSIFNYVPNPVVLNFNYTNTVKQYIPQNVPVINIHGELNNKDNPIVFGYAANHQETNKLMNEQKEENEYFRFIKDFRYKLAASKYLLDHYLNNFQENIEVLIFGHSCGASDKLILNQIFEHERVKKIRIFYYQNEEDYFQKYTNIKRVSNKETTTNKVVNYRHSLRMPQIDDENAEEEIKFYFENIFQN